jgi:tRNA/rRNA methyltransferase
MVRNLRHWFNRGEMTTQEVRTLHGVVAELSRGRMVRGRPDSRRLEFPVQDKE